MTFESSLWPWLFGLQWLFVIGTSLSVWLRKPGESAVKAVEQLESEMGERLASFSSRVVVLEERLRHMPTSEELAQLAGSVQAIQARVDAIASRGELQSTQLARIEQYLLSNR